MSFGNEHRRYALVLYHVKLGEEGFQTFFCAPTLVAECAPPFFKPYSPYSNEEWTTLIRWIRLGCVGGDRSSTKVWIADKVFFRALVCLIAGSKWCIGLYHVKPCRRRVSNLLLCPKHRSKDYLSLASLNANNSSVEIIFLKPLFSSPFLRILSPDQMSQL